MPSWNIHTAHVERILSAESLESLGLTNANTFLFGNLVPDIYAGHMVQPITRKIEYEVTHLADPLFIPVPDADGFYQRYVRDGVENDLTLGAWVHLLCDHYYNLRTNEYIASIGVEPGDETRIRKQADFDMFGRTLVICSVPQVTDELLALCASFPQYAIHEKDVYATVCAQEAVVRKNAEGHVDVEPQYDLLTPEFFHNTFNEVDAVLRQSLCER